MPALATLPLLTPLARIQRTAWLPLWVLLLCVPLLWQGGGLALLGTVLVALSAWPHRAAPTALARHHTDAILSPAARRGPEHMISQLIPIWSRQMNATRQHTSEGVQSLLDAFNAIGNDLSALADASPVAASHHVDDIDHLMATARPAIDLLTSTAEQGLATARQAQSRLVACAELAQSHRQLSNRMRALARHTRLVAFNAAIEARRGEAGAHAGFITLAEEVKLVSSQMEEAASKGDALSEALEAATAQARVEAVLAEGAQSGLQQEMATQVREAMGLILQAVATQGAGNSGWRVEAARLRSQIDDIYVQFQFGDRVSQMLDLISTNMSSFVQWVSAHPHPTPSDVDQWLKDLEDSYSMEEQRAYHHGNVHVDASKGIEFF